jgi:4-hydroxy-tetrahydrodipicolinate reductase
MTDRLRVVQWATGTIGRRSLQAVLGHPGLDLVGVRVYDADKVGADAGTLGGADPTGVAAVGDLDGVLATRPDCVLYMPRAADLDDVCALLAAGVNVVATTGLFHHPASVPSEVRARVEEACAGGGSSIHATGSSPGFISEAVPLVLLSLQRRLDRLDIHEYADLSRRPSPELLFDLMGFGTAPEAIDPSRFTFGAASFGPSLRLVADAIGLPLDDVEAGGAVATAARTVEIAAGTIEAGTVAAQRVEVVGRRGGEALLTFSATWYCTTDLDRAWDLRPTGWRVVVAGDTPLDVDLRIDVPLEDMAELSPGLTAHRAVNLVAAVCAAPPGIRTTDELAQPVPVLGR